MLDSARQLFAEKGYAATSIIDIAERSGISVGGLYHHFGSKKQIFLALWAEYQRAQEEHTRSAVAAARKADATGKELLLAGVESYLQGAWLARDFEPMVVLGTDAPPGFDGILAEADRQWARQNRALLSEYDPQLVNAATVMLAGALKSLCLEFPHCRSDAEGKRLIDDALKLFSSMLALL
ncbi:hypothetical protein CcI49_18400 [Frankia sp. CcI49]|uniref:TetR/AcrR family transcriptional regulator n=1 Tax=unclassified Frankia TaxID=2632575 RepID=UPI0006CA1609|nr:MULTISPECIES: TetR/AcrR family transcriptional regulator [unclassified Frankia]ONH59115.1 hypothetical protein CcI49_18400 [Frankia sp. CcI49]